MAIVLVYKRRQNKRMNRLVFMDAKRRYAIHFGLLQHDAHELETKAASRESCDNDMCQIQGHNPLDSRRVPEGPKLTDFSSYASSSAYEALPFELVEIKNLDPSHRSSVKVVSSRQPNLKKIQCHDSQSPPMKLALASDIDKSALSNVAKATLKLRQWKATLLAAPPPLVEVNGSWITKRSSSETKKCRTSSQADESLSAIQHEISQYTKRKRKQLLHPSSRSMRKQFVSQPRLDEEEDTTGTVLKGDS